MNAVDLTKSLKKYKSGWVAVKDNRRIVAHGKSFAEVSLKAKGFKGVVLIPAAKNYFGFITNCNGEVSLLFGSGE